MMTVIVSMLLYIFGLNTTTGKLNYNCSNSNTNSLKNVTTDALGNIIIYDPEYNASQKPVYYQSPNIIIPNPANNDIKNTMVVTQPPNIWNSSSPEYQS